MFFRGQPLLHFFAVTVVAATSLHAQTQSSSSSSSKPARKAAPAADPALDAGTITAGVYRNKALALSCKVPVGWVLRTDELNARDESADDETTPTQRAKSTTEAKGGRVLLAAFSRPPEAAGEDVNASILIAAESASAYPGLKDAAQYFGPLTEVAKAQGFKVVNEPYEFSVGTKALVRADFQKDVGSRVMRQSTIALLSHGEAVSITFLGGTEDEVDGLIEGLSFAAGTGK